VHRITLTPDYAMVTIRDADSDAAVGSAEAIDAACRDIAASTGYEIYVCCVQDRLAVTVDVSVDNNAVWEDADGLIELPLTSPTGQLRVGDVTGAAIAVDLPDGPGLYQVTIGHRGRAAAAELVLRLNRDLSGIDFDSQQQRLDEHASAEHYLVRLTRTGPAPEDHDGEEWDEDD
jgi:hypothetical protein